MIEDLRTSVDLRIDATVEFSEHWLSGPRDPYQISADAPIVQFRVDGVNFGPGDPPYNFPDEYVFEGQYLQAVDVYEHLIRDYCQ